MSSGLQNEDFRALLNNFSVNKGEEAQEKDEKKERKEKKRKRREREGEREKDREKDADADAEQNKVKEKAKPKYRNRAEERRKGILKDIEDEAVLYDNKDNTIDESKFMGGDVEHTHLVKGLDFILLKKIRADLNHEKDRQSNFITFGERKEKEKDRYFLESHNNSVDCKQIYKYFFLLEHPHHKNFKNKVKNISDSIIEKNMKFQNYNKSVHNTFYKCNLNMEAELNDIPPKYIVETEEIQRITTDYIGTDYLNEIGDCFKWHSENKKKKKEERLMKRTSRFLKNQNVEEEEDSADIDIFAKNDKEEDSNSNNNDDRVEMSSSEDTNSSSDGTASNFNKEIKVDANKKTYPNQANTMSRSFGNLQYNTKFDLLNTVPKKDEKNAFGNAFKDTYDECYPH